MVQLLKIGNTSNTPIRQYYIESESEIKEIPENAPTGSTVLILTASGLKVKMKNSKNEWVDI